MAAIGAALLGLVTSLIGLAVPEVTAIVKAWLAKYRGVLEREVPDALREIDAVVASHDSDAVSQLAHRLREAAKG